MGVEIPFLVLHQCHIVEQLVIKRATYRRPYKTYVLQLYLTHTQRAFRHQILKTHRPEWKLNRALSGVWLGHHDKTALTSGRGKKQNWSSCTSSFESMNTDIYCDVCIMIVWAENIYYSGPIICHQVCKSRFIQVRRSSLIGIKRQRQAGGCRIG